MRQFFRLAVLLAFLSGCSSTRTVLVDVPPRLDLKSYGTDSLHRYLEENFNSSRPVADGSGRVHGSREVTVMAERMWLQLRKQFN